MKFWVEKNENQGERGNVIVFQMRTFSFFVHANNQNDVTVVIARSSIIITTHHTPLTTHSSLTHSSLITHISTSHISRHITVLTHLWGVDP